MRLLRRLYKMLSGKRQAQDVRYVSVDDKDIFPKQYTPNWPALKSAKSEATFTEASYYLFREAAQLLFAIASIEPKGPVTSREEAALLGLTVKLVKVTRAILRDASDGETEQQLSMTREFIEAMANLLWLMDDDGSKERFAMYIEAGLGAEKSMLATIDENVRKRGGNPTHIEKRMIVSITDTFKAAGIYNPSSIRSGKELARQGYPNIEKRAEALGEVAYFAYRASSASVHTTWSDIFKHHLNYDGSEFVVDLDAPRRRPQVLTSLVTMICVCMPKYVSWMHEEVAVKKILPLLEDLNQRNNQLVQAHEDYLSAKGDPQNAI